MRKIDKVVIHCTDSPDKLDIGAVEINVWHKERGWNGIGYHYVVRRSGKIENGRPDAVVGAHTVGHNASSIGIVWVGRDKPAPEQYTALTEKCKDVMRKYKLDTSHVFGHKELNDGKTCPNLDMDEFRRGLK